MLKPCDTEPGYGLVQDRPRRPRLCLNIGITGHRAALLPDALTGRVAAQLELVFAQLSASASRLHAEQSDIFATADPLLRLHTPLATGADQAAATSARSQGFQVRALLPFEQDEYSNDFATGDEREEFNRQLNQAEEVFALPCARHDGPGAYVMVGKAVVAAADILVAVWDGGEANGPGGTAHIVDLALGTGVPVIHVPIDRDTETVGSPRLLNGRNVIDVGSQPLDGADAYLALLRATFAPGSDLEREHVLCYLRERERLSNWRVEYPLLLAGLRIKHLPRRFWRQNSIAQDIESDWKPAHRTGDLPPEPALAEAYGWSNFLAIRYAQLFRSGHVTNYVLSALAVNLALTGLIVPELKIFLVLAELGVIGLLFLNTRAGTKGEWHRRWLQYRYLAESLRPLVYLKQTGLVSPPFRSEPAAGVSRRQAAGADWTRWYAAAIWREMEAPSGHMTRAQIRRLADDMRDRQILPQARYHQVNAHRMHLLDHRLHEIGNFLISAVIGACVLYILGYLFLHDWVKNMTGPFIFLTAGLPAVSAAVFGMRGHGEHLLSANRSANTAAALEDVARRLDRAGKLDELAREMEDTAAIMLADLNEWTAAYRERSLEIPA